jgi:predicted nucleic acid-binding protein
MIFLMMLSRASENGLKYHTYLLKAKELNIITELKPTLDEMISKGRWYSDRVYYSFLSKANEI